MFKHLGTFGILAVCLFAMTMAIVGCGRDDPPPPPPIEILPEETKVETQVEKLQGTYILVEIEVSDDGGAVILRPPALRGSLLLHGDYGPGNDSNYRASMWFLRGDTGETVEHVGVWSVVGATITIVGRRSGYTSDGTYLNLTNYDVGDGLKGRMKWRRSDGGSD